MKRSEFLKRLSLGLTAIPLAPAIVAEVIATVKEEATLPLPDDYVESEQLVEAMKDPTYSLEKCREIYKETGNLLYSSMEKPEINDELVRRYRDGEQDFMEYLRKLNS